MYYPEQVIDEVRNRNDIVSVIGTYVTLKKAGANYQGLCPFHNEKTASFNVSPSRQIYKCFGCGKGGNVITFLMEYESLTFPEAVQELAGRIGYELPKTDYTEKQREEHSKREMMLALYKEAATYYYRKLRSPGGTFGMEYLQGRELTPETMTEFGVGYSDGKLYETLKGRYPDPFLNESGLFTFRENGGVNDKFFSRVMFPIFDLQGKVIAFGGRVLGDGKPKYLNSPETMIFDKSRNLYNIHRARRTKRPYLLLCEGYMDVISMTQAGFDNAVATLGTALTGMQAKLMSRYTKDVVLTYDSDGAGQKAISRAIPILKEVGIRARVLDLRPYKDPDEFIKHLGTEEFEARIDAARQSFTFEMEYLAAKYNRSNPEEETAFQNEVALYMTDISETLERINYMQAFCRDYAVAYAPFERLVNKLGAEAEFRSIKRTPEPDTDIQNGDTIPETGDRTKNRDDGVMKSQRLLLTWAIENPAIMDKLRKYVTPEQFSGTIYQTVASMCMNPENGKTPDIASVISRFDTTETQSAATEILSTEILKMLAEEDKKKAFIDCVMKVRDKYCSELQKTVSENPENFAIFMGEKTKLKNLKKQLQNEVF